jgi:hypothetical protein
MPTAERVVDSQSMFPAVARFPVIYSFVQIGWASKPSLPPFAHASKRSLN